VLLRFCAHLGRWPHSFTRLFALIRSALWQHWELRSLLADISHVVSCPRTAWVVFVIFCLLPDYASLFSSPLSVFVRRGRCFDAIVGSNAIFLLEVKTPPPFVP